MSNDRLSALQFTTSLTTLALMLALGSPAFGQSQPSAERMQEIDRMIDAMASRNKAPTIVCARFGGGALALFSPEFDWSDQTRVREAIRAVRADKSDEMWWRLRAHIGDTRYALTFDFDDHTQIWNISVGNLCKEITQAALKAAYTKHLPKVSGSMPLDFDVLGGEDGKKWAGRPLYELQIELCERVLTKWASVKATIDSHAGGLDTNPSHTFTAKEKTQFADAVRKQIEDLKSTKQAVWADTMTIHGFGMRGLDLFNADSAKRMRDAYEKESERLKDGNGK